MAVRYAASASASMPQQPAAARRGCCGRWRASDRARSRARNASIAPSRSPRRLQHDAEVAVPVGLHPARAPGSARSARSASSCPAVLVREHPGIVQRVGMVRRDSSRICGTPSPPRRTAPFFRQSMTSAIASSAADRSIGAVPVHVVSLSRRRVPACHAASRTGTRSRRSATARRTPFSARPAIVRVRNSRLISGSTVLVRIASIMRPPLSTSVQRLTISFTASSS